MSTHPADCHADSVAFGLKARGSARRGRLITASAVVAKRSEAADVRLSNKSLLEVSLISEVRRMQCFTVMTIGVLSVAACESEIAR